MAPPGTEETDDRDRFLSDFYLCSRCRRRIVAAGWIAHREACPQPEWQRARVIAGDPNLPSAISAWYGRELWVRVGAPFKTDTDQDVEGREMGVRLVYETNIIMERYGAGRVMLGRVDAWALELLGVPPEGQALDAAFKDDLGLVDFAQWDAWWVERMRVRRERKS